MAAAGHQAIHLGIGDSRYVPARSGQGGRGLSAWLTRSWLVLPALFALALAPRLIKLRQPLLENYIDRQVHTAMMARNLLRGGSLWYPQIDVGPFPGYYMLEFPGYAASAAVLSAAGGWPLDATGRLLSALALAAGCVLLYELSRRRDGPVTGLVAALLMAAMPVTVRYGRAFQPDASMLACLMAAIWAMDCWARVGSDRWLLLASVATAGALLLKGLAGYMIVPLTYLAWRRCGWGFLRSGRVWLAVAVAVAPAAAWYVHAYRVASTTTAVSATFWSLENWLAPGRFVQESTYRQLAYYLGWRVLTPLGVLLAAIGALRRRRGAGDGLFHVWAASLLLYLPVLARKADHEHYYLALAPVTAVFMARALGLLWQADLRRWLYVDGKSLATVAALGLLATNLLACRSTFRTPDEWRQVPSAAAAAQELTGPDELIVAHSSILFYADRRGFAIDYDPAALAQFSRTWGIRWLGPGAAAGRDQEAVGLLEFYRSQGAGYLVELLGTGRERRHKAFFDYLRGHYHMLREEPGRFIVVDLRQPRGGQTAGPD